MTVSITPTEDGTGLLIEDRVEQRQSRLSTGGSVSPTPVPTDGFPYPLDTAVTVRTDHLTVTEAPNVYLRDCDGTVITELRHPSEQSFPSGEYVFEISAPVKLYLAVDGPMTVSLDAVRLTVDLPSEESFLVGARSYHERPATTITTTDDPHDLMRAVSYLPSSLKTTSPERSFPTLRGHPPELAVGDTLDIPAELTTPDSGLTIEVPPDLGSVFVVAPLAFYLGADVRPGESPRIVADSGFVHPLDHRYGMEREVERVLKQTFLLDCLTRTEGIYHVPLHERRLVEADHEFDFTALYQMSPTERLERYLETPFEALAGYVPRWKLTAHVTPDADSVEALPFLVDDLAVVRTPAERTSDVNQSHLEAIEQFTRASSTRSSQDRAGGGSERPTPPLRARDEETWAPETTEPERTDSIEHAWVGPGAPIGASKTLPAAFRNRLARDETAGTVEIVVVCNDTEMLDEQETARDVYGSREELPFDVTFYEDLTTDRLAFVLESAVDYFHYIGHIERSGFRCSDGLLDVRDLESVAVDTFFLNACTSYQQGMALIERGAVGGVVTLDEVVNSGAIRVGKAMTRLLNRGFPLRPALNIAAERSVVGNQYIVIGDGNMDIAHAESMVPNLLHVGSTSEGTVEFSLQTFYSHPLNLGSITKPHRLGTEDHYLLGSRRMCFSTDTGTLSDFLEYEVIPVRVNGRILWADDEELLSELW